MALLDDKVSSSRNAVPDRVPLRTGLVNVLFVRVCDPVNVVTVESIAISLALASIPVPPTTSNVTVPEVPPPVKPAPAVTPVISPTSGVNHSSVPLPSEVRSA